MQSQSRIATCLIKRQLNREFPSTIFSGAFQKLRFSGGREQAPVDEVMCAAIDGSPDEKEGGGREEESDREYFSHHKASPLSEIEVADTRKPVTKATDGTGDRGGDVVGWLPEQLETAEQTMLRAAEIWQWNKMRGDPDATSPVEKQKYKKRGEEESDREYFSHHKASPLSEIEVADTRKPVTKATDGTGDRGGDVVGWLPEQLETAEQTMLRAAEIWQWNKTSS